jgi:hypothetical protein
MYTSEQTPSRRAMRAGGTAALLTGAALATAAHGAPVAAPVAGGDDAELLALHAEWKPLRRRYLQLNRENADVVHIPPEVDAEIDALVPAMADVAERVADLRATTTDGLKAKAAILLSYSGYMADGSPLYTNHDELLGWSIARDLLGDEAARPDGDLS